MDFSIIDTSNDSPHTLFYKLSQLVGDDPSVLSMRKANRWIEQNASDYLSALPRIKVAVLTEQTLEGLKDPLKFFARVAGVDVDLHICQPYHTELLVLSPTSELWDFTPDYVLVTYDIEKRSTFTYSSPSAPEFAEWIGHLDQGLNLLRHFSEQTGATILLGNFVPVWPSLIADWEISPQLGRLSFFERANAALSKKCDKLSLEVLPFASRIAEVGHRNCVDIRQYCDNDTVFTPAGFNCIAELIATRLATHALPQRRALVVDVDGTLWGEQMDCKDTSNAIYSPDNYPGRIYHEVLQRMAALRKTTYQLALVSGNRHTGIEDILAREDFPLALSDFSTIQHAQTIEEAVCNVSTALGLSPEALIFLSANTDKCADIRQHLPACTVAQVPSDLGDYPREIAAIVSMAKDRVPSPEE